MSGVCDIDTTVQAYPQAGVGDTEQAYAHVKRFIECWTGDDRFRIIFESSPDRAMRDRGLRVDGEALRLMWSRESLSRLCSAEAAAIRRINRRMRTFLEFCENDGGSLHSYQLWRARQIARLALTSELASSGMALHLPFAMELTRGCSVGCWFCGLSASKLEEVLELDQSSFEAMLLALRKVFGASACRGSLYWATDPLDHPHYEEYAEAFRKALGVFPMTTTAIATRDSARARRLISIAIRGGCPSLRFSVVTRRNLDALHAAFSAEELAYVDLIPVNRESLFGLADAGHARRKFGSNSKRHDAERAKLEREGSSGQLAHSTIACVSGFLVQPLERRIRVISPTPATDRWPDGFVVFDEADIDPSKGIHAALEALAARNFSSELPEELALQRDVSVTVLKSGSVAAKGPWYCREVHLDRKMADYPARLAESFCGGASVRDVAESMSAAYALKCSNVRRDIAALWQSGILVEIFFLADCHHRDDPLKHGDCKS